MMQEPLTACRGSRPADAVGIVVAGGSGTRMQTDDTAGANKAMLLLEGETFLSLVIRAVAPSVREIIVVAASGQDVGDPSHTAAVPVRVIRDSAIAAGPLSALADGLRAAMAGADDARRQAEPGPPPPLPPTSAFVVSCDVPRLRPEVVRLVLDSLGAPEGACVEGDAAWAIPQVGGHPQVLVSAMRLSMLPAVEAHLAAGRRDLRGLLSRVRIRTIDEAAFERIDPSLESFLDVDTPRDLGRARIGPA